MKATLSFLLILLAPIAAHAQAPRIDSVNVTDYGIYTVTNVDSVAAPGTATGQVIGATGARLAAQTRNIPAQQGASFGFHYILSGAPAGANATLHFVTIFPAPGLTNPATQQQMTQSEYDDTATIGASQYKGYELTNPWEVVPGVWTMQVWYQGRKLAEQSFTLVAP